MLLYWALERHGCYVALRILILPITVTLVVFL